MESASVCIHIDDGMFRDSSQAIDKIGVLYLIHEN